jgi:hypothetical protein
VSVYMSLATSYVCSYLYNYLLDAEIGDMSCSVGVIM